MARPPRPQFANAVYHAGGRGNERSPIFRDDRDRHRFLEILAEVRERDRWCVLAYCLMTNHYHLLVRTLEPNLSHGMRQLNGVYAQWFNRRHGRVGHLFQGRYSARLVQEDEHLLATVRYIVRNPVRAGLCPEPGAWPWSSYRAALGTGSSPTLDVDALLAQYGSTTAAARERFRAHCEEVDGAERPFHPLAFGDDAFVVATLERVERRPGIPARYFESPRPGLSGLVARGDLAAVMAAQDRGYTLRQIARHVGVHPSTLSRRLRAHRESDAGATPET